MAYLVCFLVFYPSIITSGDSESVEVLDFGPVIEIPDRHFDHAETSINSDLSNGSSFLPEDFITGEGAASGVCEMG